MEYTDIRYSDIPTCIDSVSARAAQLEDGWSPNELCEGEQSHAYIIKHPIETQLAPCDGIHWHQVQWHSYVYWFCECQSWRTGDGWSPNELCEGEQSHAYIIKHPIETQLAPCDGIHWHQVQWHSYVYWFCECQSWRTGDGWSPNELCEGEQSHAYIIKHPIETQWLLVMEYTDIRYSDIPTCIDSVSARAAQLEDGWSPNELCEGEQSHAYIIKHPIEHNWLLVMEYTDIRYSDIPTCIDSVSCQSWRTGDGWSPNELCEGEQSHAYIIKHPIETQLAPCDGIHWHQVQWHSYMYWFCECQSSTTGGRMVSKWIVWGRAVSCLHNQAPNWNTIDFLRWNTLTSGTVTLLRVLILWVPELENWGTDGLQMNCVGESSLMLT